ncbi:type II toxin-antitoxin system VapC family toxin [Neorhizobium sp. LjRoot104]|uniref:type II toxin-antitoxin system VapC family toxin n=1 Tax=Neorhizobium sp. LjRoot104 TaxID=3342254 RepID=UPI003ECC2FEB
MTGKVYVDSNVLIYYVDGSPAFKSLAEDAVMAFIGSEWRLFSSEITFGECLRGVPRDAPDVSAVFVAILSNADFISLEPVSLALIKRAAVLGSELNMKLIDAIHVASAEALQCEVFLTNDRGIRAPAGIELRYLSDGT